MTAIIGKSRERDATSASFVDQAPRPHKSGQEWRWRFKEPRVAGIDIGIWGGDIIEAKDFDAWVNPENTDMEMAHYYHDSISGIIRHMGSNWSRSFGDSDDFVFRKLLESVARSWGVHRPVPSASVFSTPAGKLSRTNRVKMIYHVACAIPRDAARPGCGVKPSGDLDECMRNVIRAIGKTNRRRPVIRSVLVPLMSAGTGRGEIRSVSEILVNAACDEIVEKGAVGLERLMFLAHSPREDEMIAGALDSRSDLEQRTSDRR